VGETAPQAVLRVLIPEVERIIGSEVVIDHFPFRVGRGEWRASTLMARIVRVAKSADYDRVPIDVDLELPEKKNSRFISKDHFVITRDGNRYVLEDTASSLGTIVDGQLIGGNRRGGKTVLKHNDVIIVGSHHSGFIFKFQIKQKI
jgi:hypothetical protein